MLTYLNTLDSEIIEYLGFERELIEKEQMKTLQKNYINLGIALFIQKKRQK
jgi:hypothetical protein